MENEKEAQEVQPEEVKEGEAQTETPNEVASDEQILEMVKNLDISKPEEETPKETQEEVPEETPEEEVEEEKPEEKPQEKQVILIDDALIEQYPSLRGLRNKDILTDLPNSYNHLVGRMIEQDKTINRINNENKKLKEQLTKPVQEEEIPDPVNDPKGYKEYLQKEVDKKLSEYKPKEQSEETVPDNQAQKVVDFIQSKIEKEEKAADIIKDYVKDNSDIFYDGYGQPIQSTFDSFDQNPAFFIKNVLEHYRTKKNEKKLADYETKIKEQAKTKEKEVKKEVYDKTKKTFQKAKNAGVAGMQNTEIHLQQRHESELTDEEKLYAEIISNQSGRYEKA